MAHPLPLGRSLHISERTTSPPPPIGTLLAANLGIACDAKRPAFGTNARGRNSEEAHLGVGQAKEANLP